MDFLKRFKLSNIFQASTIKAIFTLLAAFGLTMPDDTINSLSVGWMGVWSVWETIRNDRPKVSG